MHIIILEGIATCGKSTLTKKLKELAETKGLHLCAMDEEETMWPLRNATDKEVCIVFLKNLLQQVFEKSYDVVIFDRFHFSQVFRTRGTVEDFMIIEDLLRPYAKVVLLKVEESSIHERIRETMLRRPPSWAEYVRKKGTDEEIDAYYIHQQRLLEELCAKTTLPVEIVDTTLMEFDVIAVNLMSKI